MGNFQVLSPELNKLFQIYCGKFKFRVFHNKKIQSVSFCEKFSENFLFNFKLFFISDLSFSVKAKIIRTMSNKDCEELSIEKTGNQQNFGPKFFECKEIGSGDADRVFEELNRELKLCEDVINRPLKAFKKETHCTANGSNATRDVILKSEKSTLEIYAIILKVFAAFIGFALKQFVLKMDLVNKLLRSWMESLGNLKNEMNNVTNDDLEEGNCPKWCKFLKNPFKKTNLRPLLGLPLILLNVAFIIFNIFLMISKLLVVKVHVPKRLFQFMKND